MRDRRGSVLRAERELVAKVSAVYEKWGFEPLDTSALEYADALGKFLPDQDRPNEGVFAFQDDDEQWLSLRYDLTAPLARFVAENYDQLPKPYRRWAAGPVWRNEKLGPGRFREFWQCDADTVGAASPAADAEMIAMACEAMEAAGVKRGNYAVKLNSRKVLDGLLEAIGLGGESNAARRLIVLRAIDKLDRLGMQGVKQLLGAGRKDESGDFTRGAGLDGDQILRIESLWQPQQIPGYSFRSPVGGGPSFATDSAPDAGQSRDMEQVGLVDFRSNTKTLSAWAEIFSECPTSVEGIRELEQIVTICESVGIGSNRVKVDSSIVRGLEYYTSSAYEIELLRDALDEDGRQIRFGSIGGGGRYDDLVARFRGERIPATGISIGVSRLAAALNAQGEAEEGPIVILALEDSRMADYFALARELRAKLDHPVEVYLGAGRFGAQLKYADKRNAPLAVIIGEDERKAGKVTIKNLVVGAELSKGIAANEEWRKGRPAQVTVGRDQLIAEVKSELALLAARRAR